MRLHIIIVGVSEVGPDIEELRRFVHLVNGDRSIGALELELKARYEQLYPTDK
jgi:Cdc14 phosphatase binding protein N-terminus